MSEETKRKRFIGMVRDRPLNKGRYHRYVSIPERYWRDFPIGSDVFIEFSFYFETDKTKELNEDRNVHIFRKERESNRLRLERIERAKQRYYKKKEEEENRLSTNDETTINHFN